MSDSEQQEEKEHALHIAATNVSEQYLALLTEVGFRTEKATIAQWEAENPMTVSILEMAQQDLSEHTNRFGCLS